MTNVLLVGTGYMGIEYSKVLESFGVDYTVVGRGRDSTRSFFEQTGKFVLVGGIENVFDLLSSMPSHAIIATTLESLEENTLFLLEKGIKNILVEKPGAVTAEGMQRIYDTAKKMDANVYIAYNRRFYESVLEAERRIKDDGGLTSFLFEFTEWSHMLPNYNKTEFQLNNWFIGNSTHVIDTAFYFGGNPQRMSSFVTSNLDWHPSGSIYAGAGMTEKNILFSYHANWEAPGSWKLELLTKKNRYIFRPFEKLHVQQIGSVVISEISLNNDEEVTFKPGLYKQTKAFLHKNELSERLLNAKIAIEMFRIYTEMNGAIK